jgi:hypothetical protein
MYMISCNYEKKKKPYLALRELIIDDTRLNYPMDYLAVSSQIHFRFFLIVMTQYWEHLLKFKSYSVTSNCSSGEGDLRAP